MALTNREELIWLNGIFSGLGVLWIIIGLWNKSILLGFAGICFIAMGFIIIKDKGMTETRRRG
jgi:hypothetical protein